MHQIRPQTLPKELTSPAHLLAEFSEWSEGSCERGGHWEMKFSRGKE